MATFTSSKPKVEQPTGDQESKTIAEAPKLELNGVIGFNGTVQQGLLLHPADKHLISPLGSTIVVRDLITNSQTFLHKNGHNRSVSCLTLSLGGKYLASGQSSLGSFAQAPVVIWNMETFEIIHRLTLHKGGVQDLAFSPDEKFLATLGGKDDNKLVIWDVQTGEAICGAPAANDQALTVRFYNTRNDMLVTGGAYNLRVWQFDLANRKLKPTDCQAGQLKRVYTSVSIDEKDEFMFCGTKTGDLLQFNLTHKLFKTSGPKKPFSLGITTVMRTHKGNYVVGCGDGTVAVLKSDNFAVVRRGQFDGAITSLALNAAGDHFFVGTEKSNVYLVHLNSFEFEVRNTCHNSRINDIAFPYNYSELFATCSGSDIRIWHSRTRNELLRIQVPNQECLCVCFTQDGRSILSGWADGKIRAFGPQTGKSQYVINDAHQEGVTAITSTKDSRNIISGGKQGQLRVWSVTQQTQKMTASMKEHKGCINSIILNHNDTECVTASADGSCIVWNLERMVRSTCLFASTEFKQVAYQPDQSQLLTAGTDRKLTYWDVADGQPIRIVDGSTSEINSVAISGDGSTIVSGGSDKLCKVWDYDEGVCKYIGIGHSSGITKVAISPDQQTIVSTGEEGSIFLFQMPSLGSNLSGRLENLTVSGNVKLPPMASASSANGVPQQQQQQQVQAIAQSPKLPAIANTTGTRGSVSGKKLRS